jgi:uncharacterized membrane protein
MVRIAIFASALLLATAAHGQGNAPPDASEIFRNAPALSAMELWGAVGVIVFSLSVTMAAIVLRKVARFSEDGVIRLVALILIVSGSLFLVTLGYSAEQIAPVLGILGTIAGYMLGKESSESREVNRNSGGADSKNNAPASGGTGTADAGGGRE